MWKKKRVFSSCKTSDLLNVVSRAINVVAQDEGYLAGVCALTDVNLHRLKGSSAMPGT
jgi:hypothetical protein